MPPDPPSPPAFYYLSNFERALAWLVERYDDVLDAEEHAFVAAFGALPRASRALLVRMLMRKGPMFRASKLVYDEIGCPFAAAAPLVALGWIDPQPMLSLDALFALATHFPMRRRAARCARPTGSTRCARATTASAHGRNGCRRSTTACCV